MKQGLFANCYSTIHGLNLIKTHIHTFGVLRLEESLKLALLVLSRNFNQRKLTAETLRSFLRTDQFISSVRIEICSVYLL